MSLELLKGYFYNSDGELIIWYQGYGDLENLDDLLENKNSAVGFVSSNGVDTNTHKFDLNTQTIVEI
jgi:hypothetical protein|tara:strand:- start:1369 stop:1569 length:201 start_codon:yes stop_codon:yes gene_type:complete